MRLHAWLRCILILWMNRNHKRQKGHRTQFWKMCPRSRNLSTNRMCKWTLTPSNSGRYLHDAALYESLHRWYHPVWRRLCIKRSHEGHANRLGVVSSVMGAETGPPTPDIHPPISANQEVIPDVVPTWKQLKHADSSLAIRGTKPSHENLNANLKSINMC